MNSFPAAPQCLWLIGAGRVGLAFGGLLHEVGTGCRLFFSGRRSAPPDHWLFRGPSPPAEYRQGMHPPTPVPDGVLLAVPDRVIADVAAELAQRSLPSGTPVLHLSGIVDVDVLAPLANRALSVGALHPLAAVPESAGGAARLRGAWYGVEARGAARQLALWLVRVAGGQTLELAPGARPLYHAAAVFASNYVVVLLALAERLMTEAGIRDDAARRALTELARGAVDNVLKLGPTASLTGPLTRGDKATVQAHLARLSPRERDVYCTLAREALSLAESGGLSAAVRREIGALLEEAG